MAVNAEAVVLVYCYYTAVMFLAFWSRSKERSDTTNLHAPRTGTEGHRRHDVHRHLPLLLGVVSMTATWVGGGYLNGTAEAVFENGILYCHTPLGYAVSLVLGGTFFTDKMRALRPVTMLDPFQHRYGRWMALLLCFPAVASEVIWTAAVLAALGDTAAVILEVEARFFVVTSAMVVFFYTSLGGFYVVARTDVLQILTTAVCLWICVPVCLRHHAVGTVGPPNNDWIGSLKSSDVSPLLDLFLMTALGGIPWQVYFQRVLSCDTDFDARLMSYFSAVGCILLAIPPAVIGAAAKTSNFTAAGYHGPYHLRPQDTVRVLPYSIHFLTSGLVSILGLLGITAAIMSSADSSMLSASFLVTKNVYQDIIRPTASDAEVALVLRMMVFLIGSWATYLALSVESVFEVWSLSSEMVYVLLFPQLLCLLYFKHSNTYGALSAFIAGCSFRWLLGEPSLGMPMIISLPLYDEEQRQGFPLRLTCMAFGVVTILLGSYGASIVFEKGWLPARYDVFHCCHHKHHLKDNQAAGAFHVPGSAHVPATGPVHSEAPNAASAPQARRPSHSPRKDSKAAAEDEAPDQGTKDTVSTASRASTASKRSTTVDAVKAKAGSTTDLIRPRGVSSNTAMKKQKTSVGDLSKTKKGIARAASDTRKDSAMDLGKERRTSSLSLRKVTAADTNVDMAWHPTRNAKPELQHEAKDEVKGDGSQASGSGSSRSRRQLSSSRTVAAGGAPNSSAAPPEPEHKTRKERW